MNLRPMGKRILISLIEGGNFSTEQGGIILPDIVKGNLKQGKVFAIGDCEHSVLNVGDITIFFENISIPIKINNENFLIIEEKDILAVVTDK